MVFKIKWTKRAEARYVEIIEYLNLNWPQSTVKNFNSKALGIIDMIANNPEIGIVEGKPDIRSFLIVEQIRLYYRIKDDTIRLLTFFDTRQAPEKLKL